jgi:hypothetical protein
MTHSKFVLLATTQYDDAQQTTAKDVHSDELFSDDVSDDASATTHK